MTPNKDKLLAHLRKQNPELMELSFGCEVEIKGALPEKVGGAIYRPKEYTPHSIISSVTREAWRIEELKIIGHPPEHRHLLMALQEKDPCICFVTAGQTRHCEIYKWNGDIYPDATMEELRIYLNLTKPLTEIDEETAEKINKLLSI
jgi:hypothetical protein